MIYDFSINKKSVSSSQHQKNLNITQRSTWGMGIKIRSVLKQDDTIRLSGIIEIDECFISKSRLFWKYGGFSGRKEPILGIMERGGKAIVLPIENRKPDTLTNIIRKYVVEGSTVYTDGWLGYKDLSKYYNHEWINHSEKEFVRDNATTNSIENVWRFLKTNIRGAHHSVSSQHVSKYIDEYVYKFNNRHLSPMQRFDEILLKCLYANKEKYVNPQCEPQQNYSEC